MFRKIFQKSVDVLIDLKNKNFECYVLSNWSWETFKGMENEYKFLNLFDGLIISGKEKMIKPNKEVYILAIERFKLESQKTVFIDDKLRTLLLLKNLVLTLYI